MLISFLSLPRCGKAERPREVRGRRAGPAARGEPDDAAQKASGPAGYTGPNERESGKPAQPRGIEPPQGDGEGEEYSMSDLAKRGGDSESADEAADVKDAE